MGWRLIFMGSDPIALPGLRAIRNGHCGNVEIAAVFTQPDRAHGRGKKITPNAIKVWAKENQIAVYQPEKLRKEQRLQIEAIGADIILVMAYGHILSQSLIALPTQGSWNLHTSLLPKYRGASPIQCAVATGDRETGVSLMKMVREMDAGPVLDVEKVVVERLDTALVVESKLSRACVPLLERNLAMILKGEAQPKPQSTEKATYVRKLTKADGVLDFNRPAKELACRINGLYPWPGVHFVHNGETIKVGLADYRSDAGEDFVQAGRVLGQESEGLAIACSEGVLLFKRLQRPGGKMLDVEEFLRGYDLSAGEIIDSRSMPCLVTESPFERA